MPFYTELCAIIISLHSWIIRNPLNCARGHSSRSRVTECARRPQWSCCGRPCRQYKPSFSAVGGVDRWTVQSRSLKEACGERKEIHVQIHMLIVLLLHIHIHINILSHSSRRACIWAIQPGHGGKNATALSSALSPRTKLGRQFPQRYRNASVYICMFIYMYIYR